MLLERLRSRTKTKPNPVFYAERFRRLLDHERAERAFTDPASVDLLTWNVFASLDHDDDREYVAHLLEPLGGSLLSAPLRVTLWTGRDRDPLLRPGSDYVRHLREQVAGDEESLADFVKPLEVPVRIESRGVLALVDVTLGRLPRGAGGRDRLVELIDAGLEHARHLSKPLTVTVVYRSGTPDAAELSARVNRLRDPAALAAALPWRERVPEVGLREVSWQHLLKVWEAEHGKLPLFGQPVREFLSYCRGLGLR